MDSEFLKKVLDWNRWKCQQAVAPDIALLAGELHVILKLSSWTAGSGWPYFPRARQWIGSRSMDISAING
jgi:hypothetical protein